VCVCVCTVHSAEWDCYWCVCVCVCVYSAQCRVRLLLVCVCVCLQFTVQSETVTGVCVLCTVQIETVHTPIKLKCSRFRPGVAQSVGRVIALLFHDRPTRRRWVVSSTPRPHFTPGKDPVPILQKAGWAPGLIWTGGRPCPHRDSIPDRPTRSQSPYQLSYPAYTHQ